MESFRLKPGLVYQLSAVLIFLAALALVHASVESGMNDDWSYIYTVRELSRTGHLRYNGWAAPLIGFQAYWGALFVKLFGFSFLTVRASCWGLTVLSIPVLWSLIRMAELSETQSFLALLAFLLSPLDLPTLATFMTDMPAFLWYAASVTCAMKAWRTDADRKALVWILACAACGFLSGSIRQVYWAGAAWSLLVLAYARFQTVRTRLFVALSGTLMLVAAAAALHWFGQQPFVPSDKTIDAMKDVSILHILVTAVVQTLPTLVGAAVFVLPFSLPVAWGELKRFPLAVVLLICAAALAFSWYLADPLPWRGNTVTLYGVLLPESVSFGERPEVLPQWSAIIIAAAGITSTAAVIARLGRKLRSIPLKSFLSYFARTGTGQFSALTVPFLVFYLTVIAFHAIYFGEFDRYLIPVIFVASIVIQATESRRKVSRLSWTIGGIFALYAAATTHDYFAEARAKLQAVNEVLHAGHPRSSVLSGFEFDCWTQADSAGYINSDLVANPKDAYLESDNCNGSEPLQAWWRSMTPRIKARFVVTLSPIAGLTPANLPNVSYSRWLPVGKSNIYVEQVPENQAGLSCEPDSPDQ